MSNGGKSSQLRVHTLSGLHLKEEAFKIAESKGCHLFATATIAGKTCIAVAVKKKVLLFVVEGKKAARLVGDIALLQPATLLTFVGSKLCCGHQGYVALYAWGPQANPEVAPPVDCWTRTNSAQMLLSSGDASIRFLLVAEPSQPELVPHAIFKVPAIGNVGAARNATELTCHRVMLRSTSIWFAMAASASLSTLAACAVAVRVIGRHFSFATLARRAGTEVVVQQSRIHPDPPIRAQLRRQLR